MASSSADCVLGGVRLISSASRILPKIGPSTKVHLRWPVVEVFFNDVGAGDVGRHQVGRELDAAELEAERVGDGAHHQRLRRARHAGQQAMAADEERDQDLVEHFLLADDHFAHLLEDLLAHRSESARCAAGGALRPDSIRQKRPLQSFPVSSILRAIAATPRSSFCAGR